MSPVVAFSVITWAAIMLLFFALAAVLREVRLLRGTVLRDPDGFVAGQPDISLGARFAHGGWRIVLAADSGCPLCLAVIERLNQRAVPGGVQLLTHEAPAVWGGTAGQLQVVSDREAWRAVAHLSPPVLMLVDGSGRVRRMLLPVRVDDVDGALAEWIGPAGAEVVGVADACTDS